MSFNTKDAHPLFYSDILKLNIAFKPPFKCYINDVITSQKLINN